MTKIQHHEAAGVEWFRYKRRNQICNGQADQEVGCGLAECFQRVSDENPNQRTVGQNGDEGKCDEVERRSEGVLEELEERVWRGTQWQVPWARRIGEVSIIGERGRYI